jgi:hypothetical protein
MSLQGKSDEDIRAFQDASLSKLRDLGGNAGNTRLIREIGWPKDEYWIIRDRMVDLGLLRKYRAYGGAVTLVDKALVDAVEEQLERHDPSTIGEDTREIEGRKAAERDLYEPIASVLRGPWAKHNRFRHHLVEVTANQGRRNTGGTWTRPDLAVAAIRVFPFLPGKYFDLITFEINPSWALRVTGVYEALAHRRAGTQSYLWLHYADLESYTEVLALIQEEAEKHGIGLIVASDPCNFDTWDQRCDPERVEPDPDMLNEFIALQMTEGAKDELAAWVR